VAIMALEPALDTGPVYALERVAIAAHETAGELQLRLSLLGATALLAVVAALAAGTAVAQPQPSEGVSYAAKLRKEEALIDWHGTARQIELAVRAFNPWPVAETTLAGARVRIWRAHAVPVTATTQLPPGTLLELRGGALHVACGSGELAITELQLPGKRAISAAEFARAHPLAGLRFGAGGG
jgi:methionyl-tRNA formyltransferase